MQLLFSVKSLIILGHIYVLRSSPLFPPSTKLCHRLQYSCALTPAIPSSLDLAFSTSTGAHITSTTHSSCYHPTACSISRTKSLPILPRSHLHPTVNPTTPRQMTRMTRGTMMEQCPPSHQSPSLSTLLPALSATLTTFIFLILLPHQGRLHACCLQR